MKTAKQVLQLGKELSKRELAVLKLLKQGLKNREIAKELDINEKTVSTYILRLKTKIGVDKDKNVYYVVVRAIEIGIV